ncbi:hypothetical protein [Actinoplanes sp. NPDC020271]|uniref:hypothetical protein n=1 Tax=Actinoplanes sp. NPDC020271 TaxID=3363896 RepID=UPI0037B4E3EC
MAGNGREALIANARAAGVADRVEASSAVGQALQRLQTRDEQRQVAEQPRSAAADATEQARAWLVEATARAERIRAERRFRSPVAAANTLTWSRVPVLAVFGGVGEAIMEAGDAFLVAAWRHP